MITPDDLEESLAPQNVTTFKRKNGEAKEGSSSGGGGDGDGSAVNESGNQEREVQAKAAQKAMLVSRKNRILKRRAKRRVIYLEQLKLHPDHVNSSHLPTPNPERWIPKRLRHSKTRNRGRRGREKQMQGELNSGGFNRLCQQLCTVHPIELY